MEEGKVLVEVEDYIAVREDSRILESLISLIVDKAELRSYDKDRLTITNEQKIFDYLEINYPDRVKCKIKSLQEKGENEDG